jgi:DNA-binding protein YbaB
MELEEIEVTIDKDGHVQIQVRGVKGMKCLEITKELEEALGGEILARIMTPEALEQENQTDIDQDQHLKAAH